MKLAPLPLGGAVLAISTPQLALALSLIALFVAVGAISVSLLTYKRVEPVIDSTLRSARAQGQAIAEATDTVPDA